MVELTSGKIVGETTSFSGPKKGKEMNREQAHIGCIDGGVLEVRWHSGEVALVSGTTKVRLSTEAAANLGGILAGRSTPPREENLPPRPLRRRNRSSGAITSEILDYITSYRPGLDWNEIAIKLDRERIMTVTGKKWTGNNLKCAFQRYAATSSPYAKYL